jgi:hypothetical protein
VSEDLIDWLRDQLNEDEQIALAIEVKEWTEESSWFNDMLYEYAVAAWLLDRDKPNPPTVHLGEKAMAEAVLQALALPYSDRPGYREEWRTQ